MSTGELVLLSKGGENKTFEPINNVLHVGSNVNANVCLEGLKPLGFTIAIDTFGRVSIIFMSLILEFMLKSAISINLSTEQSFSCYENLNILFQLTVFFFIDQGRTIERAQ